MIRNDVVKWWMGLVLVSVVAAGCGPLPEDGEGDVESEEGAVRNGDSVSTNSTHLGALYTPLSPTNNTFFPRPCSSNRLTADGWYLTSRHCMTDNGFSDGNIAHPSQLRLTEKVSPGLASQMPSDVLRIDSIIDSPEIPRLDVVLVHAVNAPSAAQGSLAGFFLPNPLFMVSKDVRVMGYGRRVDNQDPNDSDAENRNPPSGAGTLRSALMHVVTGFRAGFGGHHDWAGYDMKQNSALQLIMHGDSGGPSYLELPSGGSVVARLQTGVHNYSNYDTECGDEAVSEVFPWITQSLKKFYIKRLVAANGSGSRYLDVQSNNPAVKTPVWMHSLTDTGAQHWTFDMASGAIKNENGKCLDIQFNAQTNGTPVWMWDCTGGTAQQWSFTDKNAIKNVGGKCLDVPGGQTDVQLQIWDCLNNTNQQFIITAAP